MNYAGFWIRFLASLIDGLITWIVFAALVLLVTAMGLELAGMPFIFLAITILYYAVMQASARQATFGKAMLGLKVTDTDGQRISLGRALGREVAKIVSTFTFLIGYVIAAFTNRKQALHDFIGSTLVVRVSPGHVMAALAVGVVALFAPVVVVLFLGVGMVSGMVSAAADTLIPQPTISAQAPKPAAPPAAPAAPKAVVVATPAAPAAPAPVAQQPTPAPKPVPVAAPAEKPVAIPAAAPVVLAQAPAEPPKPAPMAEPPKEKEKPKPVARKPKPKPEPAQAEAPAPAPAMAPKAEEDPGRPVLVPAPRMAASNPNYNDLGTAVLYGDGFAVQQLLSYGKWPDKPDSRGMTPLMLAAQKGDAAIAEALLKAGANPNRPGPAGLTAMTIARERNDAAMAGLLKRYGGR